VTQRKDERKNKNRRKEGRNKRLNLRTLEGIKMHIGYWWEIQKERDHWEDQDVGGWTVLKWILER
jgi:hypothetical protein